MIPVGLRGPEAVEPESVGPIGSIEFSAWLPQRAAETLDKIIIIAITIVIIIIPVVRIADLCIYFCSSGHRPIVSDELKDRFSNGEKKTGLRGIKLSVQAPGLVLPALNGQTTYSIP
jgi:hypothetical protein